MTRSSRFALLWRVSVRVAATFLFAARSFVAEDRAGRIILGTTAEAFFSLKRLADVLRTAPLDLAIALNGFRRDQCGRWELATRDGDMTLLTPLFGRDRWALPIVLAVLPK